jgi:hypothetical protein
MEQSEKPRSPRSGRCRFVAPITFVGLWTLACTISPVVTVPESPSPRYIDCEHAARNYCEEVVRASDDDLDRCVAEQTFRCVSGRHD